MVHALLSAKENLFYSSKLIQKRKKINKLNRLPLFYCEQRPICRANPNPRKQRPTGKKATVVKEKNFGSGIGMTRLKQPGWRDEKIIVAGSGIWKPFFKPSYPGMLCRAVQKIIQISMCNQMVTSEIRE